MDEVSSNPRSHPAPNALGSPKPTSRRPPAHPQHAHFWPTYFRTYPCPCRWCKRQEQLGEREKNRSEGGSGSHAGSPRGTAPSLPARGEVERFWFVPKTQPRQSLSNEAIPVLSTFGGEKGGNWELAGGKNPLWRRGKGRSGSERSPGARARHKPEIKCSGIKFYRQ